MRVRRLTVDGDYQFGNQQADFWKDVPDGPAQCVSTRLQLQLGDWFLDLTDGTAWKTKVLGKYTGSTRDPMLRARILGTQGVKQIASYASQVNRDTRAYSVQVTIDTIYGGIVVNVPAVPVAAPKPGGISSPLETASGNLIFTASGQALSASR